MEMRNKKGAGSVILTNGKWYARWRIGGAPVYGEAREDRDDAERDRLAGPPGPSGAKRNEIPTLQDWALSCMEGRYGQKLADSTFDTNESIRLNHVQDRPVGKKRLDKLTHEDCQRFADGIPGSPSWIRRVCAFVAKVVALGDKQGYLKPKRRPDGTHYTNPMKDLDLPTVEERENRVLAPEEAERLMNPERRIDAIMLVAMHTGMRKSEILRLQWSHVKERIVMVPGTKNSRSKNPVPLSPEARAAILSQPKRGVFVFTTESGKPLSPRNVSRDVTARKKQLGLPEEMRLHDLRGTFGSLMMEGGEDLKTVQTLMRHADARTTSKLYLRSRSKVQEGAIETLRLKTGVKPVDEQVEKNG
jgi:hypothetical protein